MHVTTTIETFNEIKSRLDSKERVYFTRFGDNDIFQMDGFDNIGRSMEGQIRGGNKTLFTYELQKEMREAFEIIHHDYMKAVSLSYKREPFMDDNFFQSFDYKGELIKKIKKYTHETSFYNPVTFQYIFTFHSDMMKEFVRTLKGKKLFIGSSRPDTISKFFGGDVQHVDTPPRQAYEEIKRIWKKIDKHIIDADVVIPNCGQTSRVITKRLWKTGYQGNVIDMGSVFDALEKKLTRSWIRASATWLPQKYDNILSDHIEHA